MRKLCAFIAVVGVLTACLTAIASAPAQAFSVRIGPFHIGIPFFGFRHRHHHIYARATPGEMARAESHARESGAGPSPLIFPGVAAAGIFDAVFWPNPTPPWPFGYSDIFATAFAKPAAQNGLCNSGLDVDAITNRISEAVAPTVDQMRTLQKLAGAIGEASGYLARACPHGVPDNPLARLSLMQSQVQVLTLAIDTIRQPLRDFMTSLSDEQRARFDAEPAAVSTVGRRAKLGAVSSACIEPPAQLDLPITQIDRAVQPSSPDQRAGLAALKASFHDAAADLDAHCPTSVPPTPVSRLEAIEARLDATWRAVLSIRVALASFQASLSDAQKGRLDTLIFVASR